VRELSFDSFRALAADGGTVPVWRDFLLDALTPVEAFARLRRGPFDFLLESTAMGSDVWARYTFIGSDARRAWRMTDGMVEDWTPGAGWHGARRPADPLADLQSLPGSGAVSQDPTPFWAGAVGYVGYDVVRHLERLPAISRRDTTIPEAMFIVPAAVLTLDKFKAQARVVAGVEVERGADARRLREAFDSGRAEVERVVERLRGERIALPPLELSGKDHPAEGASSRSREEFLADVERAKEYIRAGDAFQIVLSRRIELHRDFEPAVLYRALRAINPSPYMYHLAFGDVELVGSSPELLVRVADRRVVVRPIAGTRPRPEDPDEDESVAQELSSDPKERAEHLMLVDLGRNDVGRVARYGTVHVDKLLAVERYSHVLHLVSDVSGELAAEMTALDALRATFPAGTMSGAPKVRAMEIIDELEPVRRGPYAGAIGFIAAGGRHMDLAVTIRTCVIERDRVFVQAGAGIVADSVPEKEWEETEKKAQAVLVAITHAREHARARARVPEGVAAGVSDGESTPAAAPR
jgi:anthranilate synthase component I